MMVIVYTRPEDGGVSVVNPNAGSGLTLQEIAQKDVPAGVDYWVIDSEHLPSREHRNAWTFNPGRTADGKGERL